MSAHAGPDGLMTWPDLLERPRPDADLTVRYGRKVNQLVDLWLPIAPSLGLSPARFTRALGSSLRILKALRMK